MNSTARTARDRDTSLGTFVAELTTAAYGVALRHGAGHSWLDLQLEMWRALTDTVQKWAGDRRQSEDPIMPFPPFQTQASSSLRRGVDGGHHMRR
jgi:hypothetical protein